MAARAYRQTLASGAIPHLPRVCSQSADSQIFSVVIRADDAPRIDSLLSAAYSDLNAGDILVVDADSGRCSDESPILNRDVMAKSLYRAGFDCPLIWAGRKLLRAETRRRSLFERLIPLSALGAGPKSVPGVGEVLVPRRDQLIAIALRGALLPPSKRAWRLSVVMPVYNEYASFREVMTLLLAKNIPGFDIEICVVESNSTDGTRNEVLRYADHPRVRLLLEEKPSGKGHAVRKGLELATGDIVLIQDADLEYDIDDYDKLVGPIRSGDASFVLGSRHARGASLWRVRHFPGQQHVSSFLNLGHALFTWIFNVTFRQRLRDPFTMYKVFRRDCIHNLLFDCNRFDFDIELAGKLVRNGFPPIEIDIRYRSRSFQEGKKVSILRDPPTWIRAA